MELYESQLESLRHLQYTPLLAEVNKHQCDFGLTEVEEVVYVKGIPKTSTVEEKQKGPRWATLLSAWGEALCVYRLQIENGVT